MLKEKKLAPPVDPPSFLLRRSWVAFCRELLVDEQPHQWTPRLLSELLAKLIRIAFEKNWKWGYFKEFGRMKGYRFIRSRLLMRSNSLRFVGSKVVIDGFLFGPLDLLVFFSYIGFATGKSVPPIRKDLKRDFIPAFVLEGGFASNTRKLILIVFPALSFLFFKIKDIIDTVLVSGLEILLDGTSEEKSQVPNEALLESVFDTLNYILLSRFLLTCNNTWWRSKVTEPYMT
ncbi:hypothetical protein NC652_017779 [Populus alba x Populus x berolinensis]|nr:hypothetical protein NC652_017779 [Populus alba x Populus x berolinensis]